MQTMGHKPTLDLWTALASCFFLLAVGCALFGFSGAHSAATESAQALFYLFVVLLILSGQLSALRKRPLEQPIEQVETPRMRRAPAKSKAIRVQG